MSPPPILPIVMPPLASGVLVRVRFASSPGGWLGDRMDSVGLGRNAAAGIVLCRFLLSAPFAIRAAKAASEGIDRRLEGLALTVIHVCHSLAEAAIADRVGVIEAGAVQQAGPLAQLRANPATEAVARLMRVGQTHSRVHAGSASGRTWPVPSDFPGPS